MQKIIAFCLVLFLFMNIPSAFASEGRFLKDEDDDSGYGYGYTPSYEEDYGSQPTYGGSSNSGSGSSNSGHGSSNSGSGSGYGSSYGSYTPAYEEKYEEKEEEKYEEEYEEEKHEEKYEEEKYEEEKYEEKYEEEKYEEKYEEEKEEYEDKEEYEEEKHEEEKYEEEKEEYEEEEEKEEYESPYNSNNNYGGYGSMTPSYEEEYESSSSYYGGYEENTEEHEEEVYNNNEESGSETPEKPVIPTSLLTGFVVDIHFLAGDPRFQYIAYHYCSELYPGYTQCDIYNGTAPNSKMVATEIVVSAEIFAQLPMQERKYWHSHAFAIKSGLLVSPNTPDDQDLQVMSAVMNTYGKVTDFFHSYQSFPYGGAKLAYGLAEESQINVTIAQQMDQALGLKTTWKQRAEARKNLNPTIIEGADAYLTTGEFPQYVTKMFPVVTEDNSVTEESNETGPEDSQKTLL